LKTKIGNYHGSVFSRKRAVWGGMDQGKGQVYRGDFVEMTLNVNIDDNVFKLRDGSERAEESVSGINAGKSTISGVTVVSGTNVFFGEELQSLVV